MYDNVNIILNNSNSSKAKAKDNIEINLKSIPFKNDIKDKNKNENNENHQIIENKIDNIDNMHKIEEEKKKEFFNNSPVIYFFIKIFLLFEGQIIRILIQLGDFYFSTIITNIYLEIILIQICASAVSGVFIQIYAFISAIIFCFLMKIILTISYWELYQLKWFELNPFESITTLLNLKLKNYIIRNIYYITNIILGILFWLFIIGLITMSLNNGKFLDAINLIIFIIIPFLKYIILYLCYCYICIKNLVLNKNEENEKNEENPFYYWLKLNNLIDKGEIKIGNVFPNDVSKNEKMNCIEKLFCKNIIFGLKICKGKILQFSLKTLLKIFFALLSFIYIIYLFCKKGATVSSVFFLLFIYLISLLISIQFPTPLWLINSIYRWYLKFKKKYDIKYQIKCRKFNEKFGAFKVLDSLPLIVSILIIIVLIFIVIIFGIADSFFITAEERINENLKFKITNWERENFSDKSNNIEHAICFTDVYGLSILKIVSLAYASYMKDPENIINYYENSIFKEKIEKITEMRYLNINSKYSIVLMINLDIPGQKPLTVFSVQASLKKLDFWLDLEMFCSSLFFTITRILSLNSLESLTTKAIIWILSIPIRILEKFTLFSKYIKYLIIDIDEEIQKIGNSRNIIFTGHSLGGGLAKYLGWKYHKENIAVSGPGITPLEYKLTKEKNNYKYFKSNLIDIVPDNDIVPRIENSGGIRYRVLCEKGYIECHQIGRILCQIGATCRREDLIGDLCMSIFGKNSYKEIRELAGIKSNIPDEYNN